jgi:hypothetical protein
MLLGRKPLINGALMAVAGLVETEASRGTRNLPCEGS